MDETDRNQRKTIKFGDIFSKISTRPNPDSVMWLGRERSIIATILLWGLYVCRLFSLLQIIKFIYRREPTDKNTNKGTNEEKSKDTDKGAKRPNFPHMYCEIYYILWFILLLTLYLLDIHGPISNALVIYCLFESIVWVVYYTIFRRFYEEKYAIYHELEYLTILIIVLPLQALGFANLYHGAFDHTMRGLLGSGDGAPILITFLGVLFGAIVISMIISAFPTERVKKRPLKIRIVGGGDVVSKRLYPALQDAHSSQNVVKVFDLESYKEQLSEELNYVDYFETEDKLRSKLSDDIDDNTIVWVETPTSAHIKYLKYLIDSDVRIIALEKPISYRADEIGVVKDIIAKQEKRDKVFFLSYYALEKALPLNMLHLYNEKYEKYLNMDDKYFVRNWRMYMGPLTNAEVIIHEGRDHRTWVQSEGGQIYETFLHNLILASLIVGRPFEWDNAILTQDKNEDVESVTLSASIMGASINLSQKKGVSDVEKCRYAKFEFSYGSIEVDFETQRAKMRLNQLDKTINISIKESYRKRYSIMVDLVLRCYEGEFSSHEVDGLENQIECLEWISQLQQQNVK